MQPSSQYPPPPPTSSTGAHPPPMASSGGGSGYQPGMPGQAQTPFMAPPTQPGHKQQPGSAAGVLTQPPGPPLAAPPLPQHGPPPQEVVGGYTQQPSMQQRGMQQAPPMQQTATQQQTMPGPPMQQAPPTHPPPLRQPPPQQQAAQPISQPYPAVPPSSSSSPQRQQAAQQSAARVYPPPNTGNSTYTAPPNPRPAQSARAAPSQTPAQSSNGYSSRIDPSQIPRPLPLSSGDAPVFETRNPQNTSVNPPPATSAFIVRDTGNCSPRFIRPTLSQIPATSDLLVSSGMPLALVVQPLALLEPGEEPLQVVDFGQTGPVRCVRCKAYINPFMKFVENGRRFQCNMCGFLNDCPRDYECSLGPDGRRQDADRPELCKGSVEFMAPAEYMVRDPMAPAFFFCIEVTHAAVSSGSTAAACSCLHRVLNDIPGGERGLVGLLTFDSTIHFYNLKTASGQPQMLVVGDIAEPYAPIGSGLLAPVVEVREQLQGLLESIPTMFSSSCVPGLASAGGAAMQGALQVLKPTGGRMVTFMTGMPAVGFGALKPREGLGALGPGGHQAGSAAPVGSQDDKQPLKTIVPADSVGEYKKMALEAAEHQVCIDLFLTTSSHIDLASLATLPRTTGGDIQHYHPFNYHLDATQLYNDLHWTVVRPQGLEAVMRVRCSHGLSVTNYSGAFCKRTPTDLDLPVIDCNKAFLVSLKHDDKLQDGTEACVQCALLYTTTTGERRIRVHTLALTCTTILGNLFRSADLDVQLNTYLAQVAGSLFQGNMSLTALREQQLYKCVATLFSYRKFCATTSSTGQLILPEALKLLPLYTLALQKSTALRSNVPADERVAFLAQQLSKSTAHSVPALYPRMFALHELASPEAAEMKLRTMPPMVALSSDKLDADGRSGVFLLENGREMFIWVGRHAPSSLVQQLFNVESVDEVSSGSTMLVATDSEFSIKVNSLVNEIRRQRCSLMRLRVVKRSDPCETAFFNMLAEDRSGAGMSYVEFLCYVHRQIQNRFN